MLADMVHIFSYNLLSVYNSIWELQFTFLYDPPLLKVLLHADRIMHYKQKGTLQKSHHPSSFIQFQRGDFKMAKSVINQKWTKSRVFKYETAENWPACLLAPVDMSTVAESLCLVRKKTSLDF